MIYGRQLTFWLLTFFVLAAVLWLLHDILLPFVAGIALAYVLAPLADRVERLGMNRTVAALIVVSVLVVALIALMLRVGLHPVWLIFAMFAFGYLFGFVGLLIAVPLGAAIAVLLRFGLHQYFASALYTGDKPS